MQPAAAVLTPDRIDAVFSLMAETGVAALEKVGARIEAAETDEAVERLGRTLQTVGRYLRQTIALKQRFDRDQLGLTAERRRAAEVERQEAERVRKAAVSSHHNRVRDHFGCVLWDEYEDDDAQELFDDLDERLGDLSEDPDFLDTPFETLVARLMAEFDLPAAGKGPKHMRPKGRAPARKAAKPAAPPPPPAPAGPIVDDLAFEGDWSDPAPARQPAADPPPQAQAPPPPDPPPELDLMPWERGIRDRPRGFDGW